MPPAVSGDPLLHHRESPSIRSGTRRVSAPDPGETMTAPVLSLRPTTHQQVEQAATVYAPPLLAYINDRLPDEDWSLSEDLAQDVWLEVLLHGIRSEDLDGSEAG